MASSGIYHEKQRWQLCAIHSLNNLFQEERFSKADFDKVCEELSPAPLINPHRSILGLGNYDVNIIVKLLSENKQGNEHYDAIWYDKRRNPGELCLSQIHGFILNIPSKMKLWSVELPVMRKHWIAVRSICGIYYNLDSKLESPEEIGTEPELKKFLKQQISNPEVQLFVIVTKGVAETHSWEDVPGE